MTLRTRLVVAAGACLLVVIAAFFGVQQRQEQVLLDQLDDPVLERRAARLETPDRSARSSSSTS